MTKSALIFILIFQSMTSFASCKDPVTLLNISQSAPCTGFLFSPDAEKQAAEDHNNAKYYKILSESLVARQELQVKQNEILDKRLQLYMDQSLTLAQEVNRIETNNKWENACLLYTSPSPRDATLSRMPSSA